MKIILVNIPPYLFQQLQLARQYQRTLQNSWTNTMGKSVSFIMIDSEIKSESLLESINSMLGTGE